MDSFQKWKKCKNRTKIISILRHGWNFRKRMTSACSLVHTAYIYVGKCNEKIRLHHFQNYFWKPKNQVKMRKELKNTYVVIWWRHQRGWCTPLNVLRPESSPVSRLWKSSTDSPQERGLELSWRKMIRRSSGPISVQTFFLYCRSNTERFFTGGRLIGPKNWIRDRKWGLENSGRIFASGRNWAQDLDQYLSRHGNMADAVFESSDPGVDSWQNVTSSQESVGWFIDLLIFQ